MNPRNLKTKIWEIGNPIKYSREDYIRRVYNILLRRDPDEDGQAQYRQVSDPLQIIDEVMLSEEFKYSSAFNGNLSGRRDWGCRILLFGAYGNGNLGDAIQAGSLKRNIELVYPDAEVWSCSQLPNAYPFCFSNVLPSNAIHDPNIVNQFDVLIVGGGGLLSHPHPPLNIKEWQNQISIPIVILGVGADESIIAEHKTIVNKAVYVSGRDDSSVRALKTIREDVQLIPDPVLADRYYLASPHRQPNNFEDRISKLWILKNLGQLLEGFLEKIDPTKDTVCFLEPSLDYWLITLYPRAVPIHTTNELIALIDAADLVISMRYHGCILAMMRGKKVIGIHEDKIRQLLNQFGNSKFFYWNILDFELNEMGGYSDVRSKLLKDQKRFRDALEYILEGGLASHIGRC